MKQIGERIKAARTAKNLTQSEFAKLVGVKSGSVVSSWEMGVAKPDCERVSVICNVLDISPNNLLGFKGESYSVSELSLIHKYHSLDERGRVVVNNVLNTEYEIVCAASQKKKARVIRLDYYTMPASAGTGIFLDCEEAIDIFVPECEEAEEADFVLNVRGDSMEPTFNDGDKIFVCKQDAIDIGEIGIFIINGDAYVKELGNGKLISHNGKYSPIPLKSDDSIYCCGRVLGVVSGVL